VARPDGTALLADRSALDSPLMLGSDLAKLRWRFTANTSLSVGYIGMHSEYFASGGAFGTYDGERTILPSAPGALGGTEYSSPQYPGLIGQTVPAYTIAHNTTVQTDQPLFEAELRTAIKNDTLLIRPYAGTIFNLLDGSGRSSGPDPSVGGAWAGVTTGPGCSVQSPCLVADSALAGYRDQEVDRLNGATVTLIHPVGEASLDLSYDYHADVTAVTSGDPNTHFNGTVASFNSYLPIIPTTRARNSDWSATYTLPLTRRLQLFAGEYYTNWKLDYGTVVNTFDFLSGRGSQTLTSGVRDYRHNDPHLGFTWRPQTDTALRLTAGSAITVPYAELVAGGQNAMGAFSGTGVFAERNPALQPESTVAYDLGLDHRLHDGSVVALDAFDNTIHDVFATRVTPFDGATTLNIPAGSPLNALFATTTVPVNAPLERNYGLEMSIGHAPAAGLGYRLATTFQRAYLEELPASFFFAPTSLVDGKQLDGSTSIPYTHAYGELNFRHRSGVSALLGADYTGANNWTNGPAFTVWSSMLRYDLPHGYRTQFSVENLFDHNTGTQFADGIADGGFASVNYGAASNGAPPTYGASPTTRFAIAPRTFRFQVEAHVGH
jgi:outer membrane receptor protein involved in Fe transport